MWRCSRQLETDAPFDIPGGFRLDLVDAAGETYTPIQSPNALVVADTGVAGNLDGVLELVSEQRQPVPGSRLRVQRNPEEPRARRGRDQSRSREEDIGRVVISTKMKTSDASIRSISVLRSADFATASVSSACAAGDAGRTCGVCWIGPSEQGPQSSAMSSIHMAARAAL